MDWKYKIWLLGIGAILTVLIALSWSRVLAIALAVFYLIFFPLTIKKQFLDKN